MTDTALIDRLAAHRLLGEVPREQLEWLAQRGEVRRMPAGAVLGQRTWLVQEMVVVLAGHLSIRVDRGGGPRRVAEWTGGDITGLLPYSRLVTPPGDTIVDEDVEILALSHEYFPEMIRDCHELTAMTVHVMLDRARRFQRSDLQDEKMISLGRLSAGLAHELNNPASALARTARELASRVFEMEAAALALGALHLTAEQLGAIAKLRAHCDKPGARAALSPLERSDHEEAVAAWLVRRGVRGVTAEELAETPLTVEHLDTLAAAIPRDALEFALRSLGASHATRALVTDVEIAAGRIHSLVAAVKGFTYMDQSRVPQTVSIGQGLADTMAVLNSKARAKSVTVTITVPEDLPKIEGFGGELNQVWANLIDNAIDAAPEPGQVEVSATTNGSDVIVRVVDNGPGMPDDIKEHIFEPFFTTKPVGRGTGLGLDIARRLIIGHHGQIGVDSRPGRTEFRVRLPLK